MKTIQKKLQAVENAIRRALPRTKKLSKGCKILFNLNDFHTDIFGEIIGVDDANVAIVISENLDQRAIPLKKVSKEKIIGHDIKLNDVLEWLGKIDFGLMLETDGTLIQKTSYFDSEKKEVSSRIIHRAMFDLSKPYLKDQSNEVKEFLYDLIEK